MKRADLLAVAIQVAGLPVDGKRVQCAVHGDAFAHTEHGRCALCYPLGEKQAGNFVKLVRGHRALLADDE